MSLLLPSVLFSTLFCFCVHTAGATGVEPGSGTAAHCQTHDQTGAADGYGVPATHPPEDGTIPCPHCQGDDALVVSTGGPSVASASVAPAALIFPLALAAPTAVESPLRTAPLTLAPPPLFARNRVLQI